jgi:DNA processing protein
MTDQELLDLLTLTSVPKVGDQLAKVLIGYCGNAGAVLREKPGNLKKIPGIGEATIRNIVHVDGTQSEKELLYIKKNGISVYAFNEEAYPFRLRQTDQCPVLFYYKGQYILNHPRTVAVVGTRTPTEYGKQACEELIEALLPYQPAIISGLAYGIDSIAHRSSLKYGLPTVGIMGQAMERIYPSENISLARKMQETGGILTEFRSGTGPDKENFPMRNRIIAGLSDVVIVVESKIKGGSVITAEFANEYSRDVFAIPGKTNDEFSAGCNKLIKQHKAHLLESAADIAYIMRWEQKTNQKTIQPSLFPELTSDEQSIFQHIHLAKEITLDQLIDHTTWSSARIAAVLLNLECKNMVKALPGKKYIAI